MNYIEKQVDSNTFLRIFSHKYETEFQWHKDLEDRIIYSTENNDWKFQLDNQLPIDIIPGNKIFIPKNKYHRIIKGSKDLYLFIVKFK